MISIDENAAYASNHGQKIIYYTTDTSIPAKFNINYELVDDAFNNAINQWMLLNPNITLVERSYDSIKFNYVLYNTDNNWRNDCKLLETCIIPIYVGKSDCTGMFIQADSTHVQNTVMHKIGHILGINHSNDKQHLMYSMDPTDMFSERGYYIPGSLGNKYIGQDQVGQKITALDNYKKKLDLIIRLLDERIGDLREDYLGTNNRELIPLINKYTSWNFIIEPKSNKIGEILNTLTIQYECKYV